MIKYKFPERIFIIVVFIFLQHCCVAQYVGGSYYARKAKESQAKEDTKPVDIYIASPLFVGITNHIKILNINLEENIASNVIPFTETSAGEYDVIFFTPGSATLSFKNKVTGKISYIIHYNIKRLPKDELKEEPILMLGNRNLSLIGISDLKSQKQITISAGFSFKNAVVYFAGNGFPVIYYHTLSKPSLKELDSLIAKCQLGATITFDNVKVADKNGKEYAIQGSSYKVSTDEEAIKALDNTLTEFRRLINLDFVSGTIYFSGTFINVQRAFGKDINTLKYTYSQMCYPGSIITFENCVYKNEKGMLVSLENCKNPLI